MAKSPQDHKTGVPARNSETGAGVADITDTAPACRSGSACCGRCAAGRDVELRDLLHQMQALGAVLPGQSFSPHPGLFAPERAEGAGSAPWRAGLPG